MNISRRSAASLIGALPFVGGALQGNMGQGAAINKAVGTASSQLGVGEGQKPVEPRMPHWKAARLALKEPWIRDLARSVAFQQHRYISSIDPDIEVYRSFSPMAKITFQRQRNVEREIENIGTEPAYEAGSAIQRVISKFMWGN